MVVTALTIVVGGLAVSAVVATHLGPLSLPFEHTSSSAVAPLLRPERPDLVPVGRSNASSIAVVALAAATWWPVAIGGAHLLARVLARR